MIVEVELKTPLSRPKRFKLKAKKTNDDIKVQEFLSMGSTNFFGEDIEGEEEGVD